MATTRNKAKVEEIVEVEEVEAFITPTALAAELNVNPKALRSYLRANFTRPLEDKNTSWRIGQATADAVRAHYAPKANEESEELEA